MLQRPAAWVLERYLSSLSPPDHLLYQMLKMMPVCGGGSDFIVEGSTWGRAGRFLRRIIFLVFFEGSGVEALSAVEIGARSVVVLVVVRSVIADCSGSETINSEGAVIVGMFGGIEVSTSAIIGSTYEVQGRQTSSIHRRGRIKVGARIDAIKHAKPPARSALAISLSELRGTGDNLQFLTSPSKIIYLMEHSQF